MSRSSVVNPIEEVQFGKPRIIFRRIRGRIVPILNKRQIGQDLRDLGQVTTAIGITTVASAAFLKSASRSLAKRIRPLRKFSSFTRGIGRRGRLIDLSRSFEKLPKRKKLSKSITKFAKKNPLLIAAGLGVGLIISGITASSAGFELQAKTKFGARF